MRIASATPAVRIGCGITALFLAFGTGACRDTGSTPQRAPSTPSSTPAPEAPQSAPPTLSRQRGGDYVNTRDACNTLDGALFTSKLGVDAGNLVKPRFTDTSISSLAHCDREYGPAGLRTLVSLKIMISKIGPAKPFYEGTRANQQKSTPVTDVPGVGQHATIYTDPTTGPHLLAYDGNLYLSIALIPVNNAATEQLNAQELLVACAQHVLDELRQP